MESKIRFFIGIDEAGRGPIAGPVSVGVVVWPADRDLGILSEMGAKDSKKMTHKQREKIYDWAMKEREDGNLTFAGSLISEKIIDKYGIVFAIKSGIKKCLSRVDVNPPETMIRLDGGLKAPSRFANQETIIGGDGKDLIIGLASIVAKVGRDRYMMEIAQEYPNYNFDKHKGYGTKAHYEAIKEFGLCEIHRRSFLKNIDDFSDNGTISG